MGRQSFLLPLLLGAGAWDSSPELTMHSDAVGPYCDLAVEFSCAGGQPAYEVCRQQECTTTAAYYDGSQDLSAHDPGKCREHGCAHLDGDCCGYDHQTWCADGYILVRGNEGAGDCWPGKKGYRCLPPDTPAPTSSATPMPTDTHLHLIDGTTPPEIVRLYNATAYDVCAAADACPIDRAFCKNDPSLPDDCDCGNYGYPSCGYPSCGRCHCDWWEDADGCCSTHCWQECREPGAGTSDGVSERATGTTCWNGSPLKVGETVLRCLVTLVINWPLIVGALR